MIQAEASSHEEFELMSAQNEQPAEHLGSDLSDCRRWRHDFPLLENSSVAFLDSAASAQKPRAVLDALQRFYAQGYSNIHRGVYQLSEQATLDYDTARASVADFLGARSPEEIIFTHGATEGLNMLAYSLGKTLVAEGDEIVVSLAEHHANFVPWQLLAERQGGMLRYAGLDDSLRFDLEGFRRLLNERTRIVAVTQLANALGTSLPLSEIITAAHQVGAVVVVDGAQGICHVPTNVAVLDADFYVFSGHKLYGPTGIGVLYGKKALLERMPPFLAGGDMITSVSVSGTLFQEPPQRFEAGTPHIAGAIGLHAAIEYLHSLGREKILAYEEQLLTFMQARLSEIPELQVLGCPGEHTGLLTFVVDGVHPHDLAQYLSSKNVAVRAGHHCAQPLLGHLHVPATTRASLGLYNSHEDVQRLADAIRGAISFFG
jgi:cysteine desulfurase/selenocysteine lyase